MLRHIATLTAHQWLAVLAGVIVVAVVAGLLWLSAQKPTDPRIRTLGPSFFFWLSLTYLGLLLVMAILYNNDFYGIKARLPELVGGILPIGVPWFGALGAVVISLEGIFHHNKLGKEGRKTERWDFSYNYWHIARPLFGAVLATVAFFIFILLINATGTTPSFATPTATSNPGDLIVFYVVGFLVGYREETFRELIKRATDLILAPSATGSGQTAEGPEITLQSGGAEVALLDFGRTQAGQVAPTQTLEVHNTGKTALTNLTVTVSTTDPPGVVAFTKGADQVTGANPIAPGAVKTVGIQFRPPRVAAFKGTVTISSPTLPEAATIELQGNGS